MSKIDFRARVGDIDHWHIKVDSVWIGWRLRRNDGALIDDAGIVVGTGVSKDSAAKLITAAVNEGRVTLMHQHPDDKATLEGFRASSGYVEPPQDMWPTKGPDDDAEAWNALYEWFEDRCTSASDALSVFLADRIHCTIGEAYRITDSWAKRRSPHYDPRGHN